MNKIFKYLLLVLFIAAVFYVLKVSPLSEYIFTGGGRKIFMEKFSGYMQTLGIWAPFMFVLIYAVSLIFFVPASVFTSIGGIVFGPWFGLFLNVTGAMIGGTISFFMARYMLREIASKVLQSGHFKKLDDGAAEHGFSIIIYLRLMFVPYTYLNFAIGLSKIKFKDFFWATLIGVIPGLAVITFLMSAVKNLMLTYKTWLDVLRPDILGPLALFIFSFFIPAILKHFKKKFNITKEIEEETEIND
ncbi:MAG: VTT domain-containing protein [bacterium]